MPLFTVSVRIFLVSVMGEKTRFPYLETRTEKKMLIQVTMRNMLLLVLPIEMTMSMKTLPGDCVREDAFHMNSDMKPGMV